MCKSKSEGGLRCYSHSHEDYLKKVAKLEKIEKDQDDAEEHLANISSQIAFLDAQEEYGEIDEDTYSRNIDALAAARNNVRKEISTLQDNRTKAEEDVKQALNTSRATKQGLVLLKEELEAETDPEKKRKIKFAYDMANRQYGYLLKAVKDAKEHKSKAAVLREKAAELLEVAKQMPEHDVPARKAKADAMVEVERLTAESVIEENNGKYGFQALLDKNGNVAPVKAVKTKFGYSWGVLSDPTDPTSKISQFITMSKDPDPAKRRDFYASKGYVLGKVNTTAKAVVDELPNGLKKVRIARTDGGYSPYAEVISKDILAKTK